MNPYAENKWPTADNSFDNTNTVFIQYLSKLAFDFIYLEMDFKV